MAKPDEVKANKMKCMLGFSDQVPVWVKKGSTQAKRPGHMGNPSKRLEENTSQMS